MWNFNAVSFNGDVRGDRGNDAVLQDLSAHQLFMRRLEADRTSRQDVRKKTEASKTIQRAWRSYRSLMQALSEYRQLFDREYDRFEDIGEGLKTSARRLSFFFNCKRDKQRLLKMCNALTSHNDGKGFELPLERRSKFYQMVSKVLFCREHESCYGGMSQDLKHFMRFIEKFATTRMDALALGFESIAFFDGVYNLILTTGENHEPDVKHLRPNTERLWQFMFVPLPESEVLLETDRVSILLNLITTWCRHDYNGLSLRYGLHFLNDAIKNRKRFTFNDLGRALYLTAVRAMDGTVLKPANLRFLALFIISFINLFGDDEQVCQHDTLEALCYALSHTVYDKTPPVSTSTGLKHFIYPKSSNEADHFACLVTERMVEALMDENLSNFLHRYADSAPTSTDTDKDSVLVKSISWITFITMYLHPDGVYNPVPRAANIFSERCAAWVAPYLREYECVLESLIESFRSLSGSGLSMLNELRTVSSICDPQIKEKQEIFVIIIGYCSIVGNLFELHDLLPTSIDNAVFMITTVRDILASSLKNVFTKDIDIQNDPMESVLFRVSLKAARACYETDCKVRFLPFGFWQEHGHGFSINKTLWNHGQRHVQGRRQESNFRIIDAIIGRNNDDEDEYDEPDENDEEIPPEDFCAVMLLRHAPFLVSFTDRVEMFHELIRENRQQYAEHRGHGFPPSFANSNDADIVVRRESLYVDAMRGFSKIENIERPLRVHMINYHGLAEAGVDGGGVFREFMSEVLKTAFDPNRGLFLFTDNQLLYPNPNAQEVYQDWGKALSATLAHLHDFDPQMFKTILYLRDCPDHEVDQLDLFYSTDEEKMGVRTTVDFVDNGRDIRVTAVNRYDYIEVYLTYYLIKRFYPLIQAMRAGFANVFDLDWLSLFSAYEQETVVSGIDVDFDVEELRLNCNITNVKDEHDKWYMDCFWIILKGLSPEEKKNFLKFVTGSPRAPLMGFRYLTPNLGIQLIHNEMSLPSSATCMNLLKLPKYGSVDILREKLLYAIQSAAGFELS